MKKVVHIGFNASPTNMAYNEFFKFQYSNYEAFDFYYLSFFNIEEHGNRVYSCEANIFRMVKFLRGIGEIQSIHVHVHQLVFILGILKLCRVINVSKIVYTVHTSWENLKFRNRVLYMTGTFLADFVIFVSQSSKDSYGKWILGSKSLVIRNGLSIDALITETDFEAKSGIVIVGRVNASKNTLGAIEYCLSCFPGEKITLIGDGPDSMALKSRYRAYVDSGLIEFSGLIPRDAVLEALKNAKYFVSLSKVEGMPIAVLEAIQKGLIVILSPIPPHKELYQSFYGVFFQNENSFSYMYEDYLRDYNLQKKSFSLEKMNVDYLGLYDC